MKFVTRTTGKSRVSMTLFYRCERSDAVATGRGAYDQCEPLHFMIAKTWHLLGLFSKPKYQHSWLDADFEQEDAEEAAFPILSSLRPPVHLFYPSPTSQGRDGSEVSFMQPHPRIICFQICAETNTQVRNMV
jgi:hypothetical protein